MPTATRVQTSGGRPNAGAGATPKPRAAAPAPSAAVQSAVRQGQPKLTLGAPAAGSAERARAAPEPIGAQLATGEIDLSSGELALADADTALVKEGGELELKVRLPRLAQGTLRVRRRGAAFSTVGSEQAILLSHPALARFAANTPMVLVLGVKENKVSGWVGLGTPGPVKGSKRSLADKMTQAAELLGWAGLSNITIPAFRNQFVNGVIDVAADGFAFRVGGYLSGQGNVAIDNQALFFDGSAKIEIPGGSGGELLIKKDPTGALSGKLDVIVQIGSVNGTVTATLTQGFVSVMGSVGYTSDRLSGKITLAATDEATARDITTSKPQAGGDVPIELPGPGKPGKPGKRAYCGWGQLTFRVTDWLAGSATVIVNSKGQATIVGEIAPPKEFILFEQKEWTKKIFKLEIRAGYGIPVVGQVGLFANIGLDAIAAVGPGKLYNIKLGGVYSTDPRVKQQLSIEGTLNISAFAGLRLRAEAGLVVTIIGHDIKAGVGVNAIAGVRGYVEATPRIGMRELSPGGKREYFIQGHLEIAAQPVLGFSGDLFVAIETPWWSPLSDKRWTWPLGSIEYPLPGEFGIGADVDYVLGSKQWPKIAFGEVNFDSSKFMTDVMSENTDSGSGKESKKRGDWGEGLGSKGKGGAKNKGGAGKNPTDDTGTEPVGEEETFSDGGEGHKLWFETKGSDAALMMASTDPGKLEKKLQGFEQLIPLLFENDQNRAKALSQSITAKLAKINTDADTLAAMNAAARNARAVHEREKGKKRPKGKKGKNGSRELSKKIQAAQRQIRDLLAQLTALVRVIDFEAFEIDPAMYGGSESLMVVNDKTHAGLRISKRKGSEKLKELIADPAPFDTIHAYSKSGKARVSKDIGKIDAENKKIESVVIRGGKVNAQNRKWLDGPAKRAADVVASFGRAMRIPRLHRARQFLPAGLGERDVIKFFADPAKVGKGLYRRQFMANMRDQLRDQQRGLREMSADEWLAQRAKFSLDAKAFRALDMAGRKELIRELEDRAEAAKTRAERYMKLLDKWVDETTSKVTKSDKDWQDLQEWLRRLDRAEERKENAEDVLLELKRVSKGRIDVPDRDILKARYEGTTKPMRQRILSRQDGEKKERKRHKGQLDEFLKYQSDWSELAKTGRGLAILHRPDQVAGGYDYFPPLPIPPGDADFKDPRWKAYYADLRKLFGPKVVNELIGKEWMGQIEKVVAPLKEHIGVALAFPIHRMNFKLKITPRDD